MLKDAGVVDAGASGFVSFLEGVARMIVTGVVPPKRSALALSAADEAELAHDVPESADTITYRYCTEAPVPRHADEPARLFLALKEYGRVLEQKVDDMRMQYNAAHYQSIIAIPVGKSLSGTWLVMRNSADKLARQGYPVTVVDSRLNSAARGLVVLAAAEDAAAGFGPREILRRLSDNMARARIFASVATFKYTVRGGRVSALKGFLAALTNLKPFVSLDRDGKGTAFGASFFQDGSKRKILRNIRVHRAAISRYVVVHANVPRRASRYAEEPAAIVGRPPEYIMEISPVVGLHAGRGAVAVACL